MPYKSSAQRAFMHIHHPDIAARWDKKYPQKGLPEHVKKRVKHDMMMGELHKSLTKG